MNRRLSVPFSIVTMIMSSWIAGTSTAGDTLHVGVKHAPPFVIVASNSAEPVGFSIDLAVMLAERMKPPRAISFHSDRDLPSHLEAVRTGKVDMGIAATTITAARERSMDFSYPFFRGGLGIMVPVKKALSGIGNILMSRSLLVVLGCIAVYVLICAVLIWLVERTGPYFNARWSDGIPQGIWWTIVTMSTVGYGDFVPRRAVGRILGTLVIFSGIAIFGWTIAFVTSTVTVARLETDITGVEDLRGRSVAVVRGTIAAEGMAARPVTLIEFDALDDAAEAALTNRVAAVVHDMPLLKHYMKSNGKGRFAIAGPVFDQANYGIAFPRGSPLRKEVNVVLLGMMEGRESPYRQLVDRWFGIDQ